MEQSVLYKEPHIIKYDPFLMAKCRMKKKLIMDVDTGVDDAQAIMMALADPNVEILGITCCNGNTPLENVLKNTLRVLKVCNRLDVCTFEIITLYMSVLYEVILGYAARTE